MSTELPCRAWKTTEISPRTEHKLACNYFKLAQHVATVVFVEMSWETRNRMEMRHSEFSWKPIKWDFLGGALPLWKSPHAELDWLQNFKRQVVPNRSKTDQFSRSTPLCFSLSFVSRTVAWRKLTKESNRRAPCLILPHFPLRSQFTKPSLLPQFCHVTLTVFQKSHTNPRFTILRAKRALFFTAPKS